MNPMFFKLHKGPFTFYVIQIRGEWWSRNHDIGKKALLNKYMTEGGEKIGKLHYVISERSLMKWPIEGMETDSSPR